MAATDTVICPACKSTFHADPSYPTVCPYCGTLVKSDKPSEIDAPEIDVSKPAQIFCSSCGKPLSGQFCSNCGSKAPEITEVSAEPAFPGVSSMVCPRCGSSDIHVSVVSEDKEQGCLMVILYIILAITIIGIFVMIPLALRRKHETVTYAICQHCGTKWQISN